MEMSRQRLRTGVLEASTKACPHCEGTGLMRTASSAGLSALRIIEDEAARGRGERILLRAGREAAIYLLNRKRAELAEIEARYGVSVEVAIDEGFEGARMSVESSGPRPSAPQRPVGEIQPIVDEDEDLFEEEEDQEEEEEAEDPEAHREEREDGDHSVRRRRRRRRGGRGRRREGEGQLPSEAGEEPAVEETGQPADGAEPADEAEEKPRSRRGRRGGRGRRPAEAAEAVEEAVEAGSSPMVERPIAEEPPIAETELAEEAKPKTRRRPRARKAVEEAAAEPALAPELEPEPEPEPEPGAEAAKPKRKSRAKKPAAPAEAPASEPAEPVAAAANDEVVNEDGEPRRGGWWQRTFG